MQTWRTRIYRNTRDRAFLTKAVLGILGFFIVLSMIVQEMRTRVTRYAITGEDTAELQSVLLEGSHDELWDQQEASPDALAEWLRQTGILFSQQGEISRAFRPTDWPALVSRHTKGPEQAELFTAYATLCFPGPASDKIAARAHLETAAAAEPPPRYANEFLCELHLLKEERGAALRACLREFVHPSATRMRRISASQALLLEDTAAMRQILADPQARAAITPHNLLLMARALNDKALLWHALLATEQARWSEPLGVTLGLTAAAVWFLILIFSSERNWRTTSLCAVALLMGVFSVWTLSWFQGVVDYGPGKEEFSNGGQELFNLVMYVGVPEEAVKLLLFAPLLFFLPKRHGDAKAALLAGCTGLGFALEENLLYFENSSVAVAIGRLLTANFMHVALTGMLGWQLYDLIRSRFHRAGEFLTVFALISLAHGLYDFAAGGSASEYGMDLAGIIILAIGARYYFHHLKTPTGLAHQPLMSRISIFLLGTSLLVGMVMLSLVWTDVSAEGGLITAVLAGTIAIIPVTFIYIREFQE